MSHAVHCHVESFGNPEDHALGLPQLNQQYLQTGPGRYEGQLQQFRLDDDVFVYHERLNVPTLQEGCVRRGCRMFGIPLPADSRTTLYGRSIGTSVGHIAGGREFSAQSSGPSEHVGIVLGDSIFAMYADYLGGMASLAWADEQLLKVGLPARQRASAGIVESLCTAGENREALAFPAARISARDDILEHLFCLLIDAEAPRRRGDVTRLSHSDVVNRCRKYMQANPSQPVGVLELCSLARVSRRTLQIAFLDVTGVTPYVYLRTMRLSLVRRLLRQTSADRVQIRDAAARWGFVHMGRFAADYNRMFGYLPSETPRA
ncbi:helix-turn-helix domain-containing protein (plasmid) [Cupriavidus pinatubonensis]|uniref:helix-turn-helix domain-containing protein n=1 Tax=Cupriavidus pinatubonensis TaxID=248026 RepID=UPI001C73BE57|nr:helix-turn-helix domain-containing protein [Cupriavidus pinatubonensis]QYY33542.1 helix-turn-helix domain-containing protein [Cupriavidus pinatubonensis]